MNDPLPVASTEALELRRLAEASGAMTDSTVTESDTCRLLHELQVHQIELSLQNDELRLARTKLQDALELYTELYDFAPIGYFTLDRTGRIVQLNLAGAELLGQPRGTLVDQRLGSYLTPAARRLLADCLMRIHAGQSPCHCELALAGPDLNPRYVYLEARLNASGQTCRAALLDITARKQAEAELEIAASVFETLNEGVLITDAENRIVSVNPAFIRLTGYPAADVLGQNPRLLQSGRHDAAFYRDLWAALLTTGQWAGEISNRRKTGELFHEWLSIHTVHGPDGQVQRRIGVFTDISEQKRMADKIWKQANYDTLTGLPNRQLFQDRLELDIIKAQRSGGKLAVLLLDIDQFKAINDTLGHAAGDQVLVEAARRLLACVRTTDTVARLGGDEFAVILPDPTSTERVGLVAQALLDGLAQPFAMPGETVHLTASIGITLYPVDGGVTAEIMKHADLAMYEAKRQGNHFHYFNRALQTDAQARLRLIKELRAALSAGDQLRVYFQPIVELRTGGIAKAEALVRWQHPTRGLVSPAEFIPLAEQCGLIHSLGDWVFQQSARWVLQRRQNGAPFRVSVNKSPLQFLSGHTEQTWPAGLQAMGLPGEAIIIEVTEGLLLSDRPEVLDKLRQLHAAGMRLAIDDFGTGYSALSYLNRFAADYIKIDASFIRDLETNPANQALCEAIIVMAHKLGIQVIAEGVETPAQRDWLLAAGCDFAQGYLFARPAPAEALTW